MEKLKYLVALMGHIVRTATGFYLWPFNNEWDKYLQRILREGELISAGKHTATFIIHNNTFEIWIANRWFGYGWLSGVNGWSQGVYAQFRPRFCTMYQLHLAVQEHQAREAHQ